MEYAEKVAWLRRYQDSLRRERVLAQEIERLRTEAEHITPLLTGMPGGGQSADKLPRAVERIDQARAELAAQVEQCQRIRAEVEGVIEQEENVRCREILRRRYILGQRWEQIAADMRVDERWMRRLHHRTVDRMTLESPV